MHNFIIYYYILLNTVLFLLMAFDKRRAKKNGWRTPERTLLSLGFLGGALGGILGMICFHHKTRKSIFKITYTISLAAHIYFIWRIFAS